MDVDTPLFLVNPAHQDGVQGHAIASKNRDTGPTCGGTGRTWRVAEALEYGIVGVNEGIILPKSRWRDRPVRRHQGKRHRPHLAGHRGSKYGIEEFLEVKYLCMGGIDR